MIIARFDINELPHRYRPMPHHKRGLSWTSSGYGGKIPTEWMVRLPGNTRWRRVYVAIWSNAGTAYVPVGKNKDWVVITGSAR